MPVMVERDGELRFVLGAMGGRGQPQIHAQLLLRLLAGASAQEAVAAPRWIAGAVESGDPADVVRVEDGLDGAAVDSLARAGLRARSMPRMADDFGHAQAIAVGADGTLDTGSDPRAATAG
jgi:gamma-glutamyltranspeptidase/glutathione hydrolase